jgi:hypothetical protein
MEGSDSERSERPRENLLGLPVTGAAHPGGFP